MFTILQLMKAVKLAIPTKSKLPILEFVRIRNDTLIATDLDISILMPFKSGVSTCVPAKRFLGTLAVTPDPRVAMTQDPKPPHQKRVQFAGTDEVVLLTPEDPKEFPEIPSVVTDDTSPIGMIHPADFEKIETAKRFVSTDELRPGMMAINCADHIVSTCGHKMYFEKPEASQFNEPFLLVPKTFALMRIFDKDRWMISKVFKNIEKAGKTKGEKESVRQATHLLFESGDVKIFQKIVDEPYPRWNQVIPTEFDRILNVDRESLIAGTKRAREFAPSTTHQVRLSCNGSVFVSSEDIDLGASIKRPVKMNFFKGEPIDVGFNADYLLAVLEEIDGKTAVMEMSHPHKPVIVSSKFLVMPVRLND